MDCVWTVYGLCMDCASLSVCLTGTGNRRLPNGNDAREITIAVDIHWALGTGQEQRTKEQQAFHLTENRHLVQLNVHQGEIMKQRAAEKQKGAAWTVCSICPQAVEACSRNLADRCPMGVFVRV